MDMYEDRVILCGASSYDKLFYFNPEFDRLPEEIKEDLKVLCVLFTEDVGGTFRLEFSPDGTLHMTVESREDDFFFDEIGSELKIRDIRLDQRELLEQLEMYYKLFWEETNHADSN